MNHHNPELERRLLSCLFYGTNEVFGAIQDGLTTEAFFQGTNRMIWAAFTSAASEEKMVDPTTIWRKLTGLAGATAPTLQEVFDLELIEPTSMRRKSLVADILALWRQRQMVAALKEGLAAAEENRSSWDEIWESVEPFIRKAQTTGQVQRGASLEDFAIEAEQRILHGDSLRSLSSGIPNWDKAAGPISAGDLVILAGRPGMGKTALALQIARENATTGQGATAMFSLEMNGPDIVMRLAASVAGRGGMFDNKVRAAAAREIGKLKNLHVFESRDCQTLSQIEARCQLLAQSPNGLRLIIVDYLGNVTPPSDTRRDTRERQVAEMSRRFKLLALALDCPVIMLAQFNRESEKDERRPRMSDLRESGAIEQDADRLWFLYPPEPKPGDLPFAEDAAEIPVCLYQAKCRNGQPGIVSTLKFNRPIFTFSKFHAELDTHPPLNQLRPMPSTGDKILDGVINPSPSKPKK